MKYLTPLEKRIYIEVNQNNKTPDEIARILEVDVHRVNQAIKSYTRKIRLNNKEDISNGDSK